MSSVKNYDKSWQTEPKIANAEIIWQEEMQSWSKVEAHLDRSDAKGMSCELVLGPDEDLQWSNAEFVVLCRCRDNAVNREGEL